MSLSTDIRAQLRSLLTQGCTITTEHANKRRFKTKSWLDGGRLAGNREDQVAAELNRILQEYSGEYVKLVGVDPTAKRRVAEIIVQRPGDTPVKGTTTSSYSNGNGKGFASNGSGNLNGDIAGKIRSLLSQGCNIGIERANKRRFKTKSWLTAGQVSGSINQVMGKIEAVAAEYPQDYIRIIGADPNTKTRIAELIVQRPGTGIVASSSNGSPSSYSKGNGNGTGSASLSPETLQQVRSLLSAGYKISTEHASKRRFKTKSWQSCSPIESSRESEVVAALEACLAEHAGEYVRMIGIDPAAKRRVSDSIIQRPGDATVAKTATKANYSNDNGKSNGNTSLSPEALKEVRSLLAAGYRISTEHADKRRFKSKSWQSCSPIASSREGNVISDLEACLAEHAGEYVRMIGIDPAAKRRVSETIIQRP